MDEGEANNFNSTFSIPPHLTSDYVQIVYLILTFCVCTPLNVYTFFKLSHQYSVAKSRIILLSLHLNMSDLMIMFFFVFPKICWLVTYQWLGGTVLCKIVKFAQTLSVALSSNVTVCIGLDRLVSLTEPLQIRATASWKCKKMLLVSWLFAVCCSAPQLQVWTVLEPVANWGQCTDLWTIWAYHNISTPSAETAKIVYNVAHVIVLFWLPLTVVVICYVIILKLVYKNLGDEDHQEMCVISTKFASSSNQTSSNSLSKRKRESAASLFKENAGLGTIRNQSTTATQKPLANQELRRNINQMRVKRTKYCTLKITASIVMTYIVFWLPYNVLTVWNIVDNESYEKYVDRHLYIFYNLIAVNAVVNPFIYSRLSFSVCGRRKNTGPRANVRFMMAN